MDQGTIGDIATLSVLLHRLGMQPGKHTVADYRQAMKCVAMNAPRGHEVDICQAMAKVHEFPLTPDEVKGIAHRYAG